MTRLCAAARLAATWFGVAVVASSNLACMDGNGVADDVLGSLELDDTDAGAEFTSDDGGLGTSPAAAAPARSDRATPQGFSAGGPDNPRVAAACASYCRAYAARCGDGGAFETPATCTGRCSGWAAGTVGVRGDSVACRAAFLEDARPSCVAAGPSSPICRAGRPAIAPAA